MTGEFDKLERALTASLLQTTKCVGQLASEDINFVRTADPELGKALDKQKSRLLTTVRRLVRTGVLGTDLAAPSFSTAEELEDGWGALVDVIDNLLEKVDKCLDDHTGATKAQNVPEASTEDSKVTSAQHRKVENIVKPQKQFANPPRNNPSTPFKPLLHTKPHALLSLQESIEPEMQDDSKTDNDRTSDRSFRHPYELEIRKYRYPSKIYGNRAPIEPLPFESTIATWVDTMDKVHEMLAELKQAEEIAIDLEHHENRTYIGLVSLMQISTRNKDWIVDTLKPWREELQILNEVLADPNIVKVFHGAQMDVIWLQRDLGLYLVGLFDTYHASRSLGYPKHSLAFLLKKFVNFDAQKQYQMADWRIRPLSEEMFNYARADTHFLLYVYDNMKNELLAKANGGPALIDDVLEESKKVALQRYEWPVYDSNFGLGERGWYYMLVKTPAVFSKEQFAVFRAVHRWRDQVARKDDESPAYLVSTATLFNIARDMPSTLPALQAHLTRKIDSISSRVSELLKVVQEAKLDGSNGPEMNDFMANHPGLADYQAKRAARKEGYRAAAQQDQSVADVAKQELLSISGDLKIEQSLFWGSTVHGYEHEQGLQTPKPLIAGFQVPLPNLSAEVFAINGETVEESSNHSLPEHAYIKKTRDSSDDEDVFTLKEHGGPRRPKTKVNLTGPHERIDNTEADFELLNIGKDEKRRRKAEKKKSRREQKLNQKANIDGQAFDYANASTVLYANKHDSLDSRTRGPVVNVNPYAKSLDAPKGLPKKKKDIQGRSATFKS